MNEAITIQPVVPDLTPAGLAWIAAHPESMTAHVAISTEREWWPAAHRRLAVQLCNAEGAKASA